MNDEEYTLLKKKIRELIKFEMDHYSPKQMMRRLDGFIIRSKMPGVVQYCHLLENNPAEVAKLEDFLTINVSEFFRDTAHFKVLKEKILPALLQENLQLSIWSAGCSNGSEAYSVAILLDRLSPYRTHRILATDIDKGIIAQAAAGGPYHPADIRNVPPELVDKYFRKVGEDYRVIDHIRNKVIFKQHDLTRDPFENNFDLIICRNVVIYFTDEAKKKLRRRFIDAMKLNGILFIGATETMLDASDTGFVRMSPCFYKKIIETTTKKAGIIPSPIG
jgi:chemotaxis protein methyltransferase CheR